MRFCAHAEYKIPKMIEINVKKKFGFPLSLFEVKILTKDYVVLSNEILRGKYVTFVCPTSFSSK